jgi:hypothetical protein
MRKEEKWNILKIVYGYSILFVFLFIVYILYAKYSKEILVYEEYPIAVQELKRFEFEGDTMIVIRIEYENKDYITIKNKPKK